MSLGHVLLGLLVPGEQHGYQLVLDYDEHFLAARPLASAQVSTTLGRLARDGFVIPGAVERPCG